MAPTHKRPSLRARAAAAGAKQTPSTRTPPTSLRLTSSHPVSKREKRHIKHNALMSRVRDAGISKQSTKKRRRPGKKLPAADGMGGLGDALPDVASGHDEDEDEYWEGLSDDDDDVAAVGGGISGAEGAPRKRRRRGVAGSGSGGGKMAMHSLKHRPGAMKRKERLQKQEVLRFGRNLAQLAANVHPNGRSAGGGQGNESIDHGSADAQREKWTALRNFISTTMQRDAAFAVR